MALLGILTSALAVVPIALADERCDVRVNNTHMKLLECVTVEGVREHQAALQAIADANCGIRTSGRPSYDESAYYVADKLTEAGYDVTIQKFRFQTFIWLSPSVLEALYARKEMVMPIYESFAKMTEILGNVFGSVFDDPIAGPKLRKIKVVVKYNVKDPDGVVWPHTSEGRVLFGEHDQKPTLEVSIHGDRLHAFLLKKIDITGLMLRQDVSIKGPFSKFVKFVPLLNKAYEIYPGVAQENGLPID